MIDISLKLQLLEANDNIWFCIWPFILNGVKKGVDRFLENYVFENATLSQNHPSPMPFKAIVLCSATPTASWLQSTFSETGEHLNSALVSSTALDLSPKAKLRYLCL